MIKHFGTYRKVLPQGILVGNMKAPSLSVQKFMPRLSFFKSRSKVEVKVTGSKFSVPAERSFHRECTHVI